MKSIEMNIGGPLMPRSKSRAIVRSLGELRVLEVAHARRPDAGGGELVVEPGRGPAAEIGADGLVNRRQHLQQARTRRRPAPAAPSGRRPAGPLRRAHPWRSRTAPAAARAAPAAPTTRPPARGRPAAAHRRISTRCAHASHSITGGAPLSPRPRPPRCEVAHATWRARLSAGPYTERGVVHLSRTPGCPRTLPGAVHERVR